MPNLDFAQLQRVVAEIAPVLCGGYVRHVSQPDKHTVLLEIRAQQQNFHLLVSVAKGTTRCHLIGSHLASPPTPPAFCQLVRKHLDGGKVIRLELAANDRVVTLTVERYFLPEPSAPVQTALPPAPMPEPQVLQYSLIAELWGSHSNLFLLDDTGKIMGTLYHHVRPERPTFSGCLYQSVPSAIDGSGYQRQDFLVPLITTDSSMPWNHAAELFYGTAEQQGKIEEEYLTLLRWLDREIAYDERRLSSVQAEIRESEKAASYRIYGELLKSMLPQIPRGISHIEAINYFAQDTPTIIIPIDPKLSPRGNLEKYFKRYRKLQRGRKIALAIVQRLEQEMQSLYRAKEMAHDKGSSAIPKIWQALPRELRRRFGKQEVAQAKKHKPEVRESFQRFYSSDGYEILVGRSAKDNEDLTFRVARGNDWWFHTADYPGSHVVVRSGGRPAIPQETVLDAAHLAAHYSKARDHLKVNILYTKRKGVSKTHRGKAGAVLVRQEKHFQVAIEPERVIRLMASRDTESAE